MEAFKFLLPAVQKISDKLEQAATANDLASYLGVDAGTGAGSVQESGSQTARAPAAGRRGQEGAGFRRWSGSC